MMSGTFYGVGLGPGDPELITVKALKILNTVGRIITPMSGKGQMLAGEILRYHGLEDKTEYLTFPKTDVAEELVAAWEDVAQEVKNHLKDYDIAFVTLGDPLLYGSYLYLFRLLQIDPTIHTKIYTVPGITGMNTVAARGNYYLTKGDDRLALVTGKISGAELESYCRSFETIVIYKPPVCPVDLLRVFYRICPSGSGILVENAGMGSERIITLKPEVYPTDIGYFTTLILHTGLSRQQGKIMNQKESLIETAH